MKKGIFSIFIAMLLSLVFFTVPAMAADISVKVNGKNVEFSLGKPFIDSMSRTQVPVRDLATALGIDTCYNDQTKTITFVSPKTYVITTIGDKNVKINKQSKTFDTAPVIINNQTFVPLRFVSEAFDAKVEWNASSRTVTVSGDIAKTNSNKNIILSTTTSTQDSGLLDYLLPVFEKETGYNVKVVSVGTGKAIQMGKDGEADVLLVHAKADETAFMASGDGMYRSDVMYNDFILVGPAKDPAGVKSTAKDILGSLKAIDKAQSKFVSRGDDSGTDKLEKKLWKEVSITPNSKYYVSAGQGMGAVLTMANEMQAYTLTDRATYLSMKDKLDLVVLCEGDSKLFNQYGVLVVNPTKNDSINVKGAVDFANWIISEKTQDLISKFGVDKYGKALFIPNAK